MRLLANLPNFFSLLRVALTPVVVLAILAREEKNALYWAAAASVTDAIDGELARRFHWSSRAGAYLDPIADKILLSAVYIALGLRGNVPWWLVGIIFGRDVLLLVAAGFGLLFTKIREFPPSVWGKVSTCFQMTTVIIVLVSAAFPFWIQGLVTPFVWATAAATIWSGIHYGIISYARLESSKLS
jgi:cardiolipin synthase